MTCGCGRITVLGTDVGDICPPQWELYLSVVTPALLNADWRTESIMSDSDVSYSEILVGRA